ncbi:right-handed parallel beta-helix repeat-containing protein, partial [bacterium]|nr:right-handed parallel beta-helix repeat-containing protein [bacterium]
MKLVWTRITILLLLVANANARVVRVPEDASTIQAGLDSLTNGDTLFVSRVGTYQESLVGPAIRFTMLGEFDADSSANSLVVVDASSLQGIDTLAVISLPPFASATIENFCFRNFDRYGVRSRADSVTLRNCLIDSVRWGVRDLLDNIESVFKFENCHFRGIRWHAVLTRPGNSLIAKRCKFNGAPESDFAIVSSNRMTIDSCIFTSAPHRALLGASRGPHSITNCVFGPAYIDYGPSIVEIGHQGAVTIANNAFLDCEYYAHVLSVISDLGDSVEIVGNTFEQCRPAPGVPSAFGVLAVETPTPGLERGALISQNNFIGCSGNNAVDDIVPSVYFPAFIAGNHFVRDRINGLPSIYAGNYIWQQTPVTLRDNVWENCGYAVELSAAADARFNYWGHPSGPYHEIDNPLGLGDTITGPVPFIPWLEDTIEAVEQPRVELANELSVQIYPNPFNSTVTIEYALIREQDVTLEIYDVLGRQV